MVNVSDRANNKPNNNNNMNRPHKSEEECVENAKNEEDDELANDFNDSRKTCYSNSRRFSVFSKSYDPEANEISDNKSGLTANDEIINSYNQQQIARLTQTMSTSNIPQQATNDFVITVNTSASENNCTCLNFESGTNGSENVKSGDDSRQLVDIKENDYKLFIASQKSDTNASATVVYSLTPRDDSVDDNQKRIGSSSSDDKSKLLSLLACLDIEVFQNNYYEKNCPVNSLDKKDELKKVLRSIVLFQQLYEDDLNKIIESMFERRCSKNEVIIRENDNGHYFYLIVAGTFEIYIKKGNGSNSTSTSSNNKNDDDEEAKVLQCGRKVGEYKNSGFFGELALLYNQKRSATIVSRDEGILYCMNRDKFQRLVIQSSFKRRKMYEEFLASVPLLKDSMSDYERSQVADALTSHIYSPGECIFHENDQPNGMYFIESGKVKIITGDNDDTNNKRKSLITKLGVGEYFGEMALVNKGARSASVYADDDADDNGTQEKCKLAFLDLNAFERLMGPCIELLKHRIDSYKLNN